MKYRVEYKKIICIDADDEEEAKEEAKDSFVDDLTFAFGKGKLSEALDECSSIQTIECKECIYKEI